VTNRKSYRNLRRWIREIVEVDRYKSIEDKYELARIGTHSLSSHMRSRPENLNDVAAPYAAPSFSSGSSYSSSLGSLPVFVIGNKTDLQEEKSETEYNTLKEFGLESIFINSVTRNVTEHPQYSKLNHFFEKVVERRFYQTDETLKRLYSGSNGSNIPSISQSEDPSLRETAIIVRSHQADDSDDDPERALRVPPSTLISRSPTTQTRHANAPHFYASGSSSSASTNSSSSSSRYPPMRPITPASAYYMNSNHSAFISPATSARGVQAAHASSIYSQSATNSMPANGVFNSSHLHQSYHQASTQRAQPPPPPPPQSGLRAASHSTHYYNNNEFPTTPTSTSSTAARHPSTQHTHADSPMHPTSADTHATNVRRRSESHLNV
jgi:hypothetical protein